MEDVKKSQLLLIFFFMFLRTPSLPSLTLAGFLAICTIFQQRQGSHTLGCGRMRRRQGFTGAYHVSQQFCKFDLNPPFLTLSTHASDNSRIFDANSSYDKSSCFVSLDNPHKMRGRWLSKPGQTIC